MECANATNGYYQQKCISLCAQLYEKLSKKSQIRTLKGTLYISDDVFFNFSHVFSQPSRYSLSEFWVTGSLELNNYAENKRVEWRWWYLENAWDRLVLVFNRTLPRRYIKVFETLYGPGKLLTHSRADVVYIPIADNQLSTFIKITDEILTYLPNFFCEVFITIVADLTGALCKHWPYKNDRIKFKSKANRLNNLKIIKHMENTNQIVHARYPYNTSVYQYRPCLLNIEGYIFERSRQAKREILEKFLSKNIYEFVHPFKLSNATSIPYELWHRSMEGQIQKLKHYQQHYNRSFENVT
ncbi:unnamed protein product [Didymodactylos carnosus]|uniref:Uncharacterized protein n=1 Tax=Didymodactylos carnosus TaxID=1234261 RepID=A0A815KVP7_9BILA|nr:unnamed protein product [Didymodactylos carnosus]CAF1398361.1 unnamed protein product [Didymodactylos carnosus]CAF3820489.1 unnamed protein product [Didymodactylos carnosus]CAF4292387.1 unnamed protein product [Didymodactylos carnosus]